jgi:hypothetical protein
LSSSEIGPPAPRQQGESYRIIDHQSTRALSVHARFTFDLLWGMADQLQTYWEGHAVDGTRFTAPGPGKAFFDLVQPGCRLLACKEGKP